MLLSQQRPISHVTFGGPICHRKSANVRIVHIGAQRKLVRRKSVGCRSLNVPRKGQEDPGGTGSPDLSVNAASEKFGRLEKYVTDLAKDAATGSTRNDWMQVADCWVLLPPRGQKPQSLMFFTGGAIVGAAPQYTYRLLIERLASRGNAVIAVPFRTGLNHKHIADEVSDKFDKCLAELGSRPDTAVLPKLPLYGIGHSLGAVVQLLTSMTNTSQRAGNALLSFNNEPFASMRSGMMLSLPFFGQAGVEVRPLMSQLGASPARPELMARENLRRNGPKRVEDIVDILDELEPIFVGLAKGKLEFVPSPDETSEKLRTTYGVQQNLIIHFDEDMIDKTESFRLKGLLEENRGTARHLRFNGLPGGHLRPVSLIVNTLPPAIRPLAGVLVALVEALLGRVSQSAEDLGVVKAAETIRKLVETIKQGVDGSAVAVKDKQLLANDVADWIKTVPSPAREHSNDLVMSRRS